MPLFWMHICSPECWIHTSSLHRASTLQYSVFCKDAIYVQHITVEGLSTASGIQGSMVDTTMAILKFHDIQPTIKWVDDFIVFFVYLATLSLYPRLHPFPTTCLLFSRSHPP